MNTKVRAARSCIVRTEDHLAEVVASYSEFDAFVFDVETRGPYRNRPERAEVAWLALAGPGRSDVIPMGHINGRLIRSPRTSRRMRKGPDGKPILTEEGKRQFDTTEHPGVYGASPKQLWPSTVFEAVRPLFFSERRKVGHNVKFDLTAVAKYFDGAVPPPPYGDTIVLTHLLNEKLGLYRLDHLIKKIYGLDYSTVGGKIGKVGIDHFDFWTVAKYGMLDAVYTWMLWKDQFPKLDALKLGGVFRLEMDVLEALIYMEKTGALVDVGAMRALGERLRERTDEITADLHRTAGKVWNLDASIDKGWFVYNVRGHKPRVYTEKKQQASTRAADLAVYARGDKKVALLGEYADLTKLRSTYIDGMLERIVDNRLHASFLQAGTETGRFSCANPNLQNLPRHQEERKEFSVRSFFIPPPGYRLIVADYSQIEYVLFAHYSGDPYMIKMFREGFDAHTAMASLVTGKKPDDLTPEERTRYGKVVNFAIGFGAGAGQVASQAKVSMREAEGILESHRRASPKFYAWKRHEIAKVKSRRPPHVRTMLGRIRRLPEIFAQDNRTRFKAERQAINTKIQGSAADIIKLAMVGVHREFVGTDVQMILTVHDEIVSIAPEAIAEDAAATIKKIMEDVVELRAPLRASVTVCDRWSDGK
jgi:DNA polymerase I-like protein with 3'-5' exonuclease and polymerase domains